MPIQRHAELAGSLGGSDDPASIRLVDANELSADGRVLPGLAEVEELIDGGEGPLETDPHKGGPFAAARPAFHEIVAILKRAVTQADLTRLEEFHGLFSMICGVGDLPLEALGSRIGLSQATISRWRNGASAPVPWARLGVLMAALEVLESSAASGQAMAFRVFQRSARRNMA